MPDQNTRRLTEGNDADAEGLRQRHTLGRKGGPEREPPRYCLRRAEA